MTKSTDLRCLFVNSAFKENQIFVWRNGTLSELKAFDQTDGYSLTSHIDQTLEHAQLKVSELDCIAIIEGPGSFTGLRVGMAAVKALCWTQNIPLIGLDLLQLMHESYCLKQPDHPSQKRHVSIHSRKGKAYTATYLPDGSCSSQTELDLSIILKQTGVKDILLHLGIHDFENEALFESKKHLLSLFDLKTSDFLKQAVYKNIIKKHQNKSYLDPVNCVPKYLVQQVAKASVSA